MITRLKNFLGKRPFTSFVGALILLVATIGVAQYIGKNPEETQDAQPDIRMVSVYSGDQNPVFEVLAKVEKSNIVKITSQAGGVVQNIRKTEGQTVAKGEGIVSLSTTYGGSSIQSVQREIAEENYQLTEDTYTDQVNLIDRRREIAEKVDSQADELRNITRNSLSDTKSVLSLNEQLLSDINQTLTFLESQNGDGSQNELIAQTKSSQAQLLSGVANLRTAVATSEYQVADDQEPAEISDRTRDLTQKQLDIEKKALEMQKQVAALNLRLAQIGEETMNPVSPCNGVITNVGVQRYESITPGTIIAEITCSSGLAKATASIPQALTHLLSKGDTGNAVVDGNEIALPVLYVSKESTNGYSYAVTFSIEENQESLINQGFIKIRVEAQNPFTSRMYIPIDALYQTDEETAVYVAVQDNNEYEAQRKSVQVRKIVGSFIEIESGIEMNDLIILDRGITNGQKVTIEN